MAVFPSLSPPVIEMHNNVAALVWAILAGGICASGWAPLEWWPMSLIGYGCLAWLVMHSRTAWQGGMLGLVFGVSLHIAGQGWIWRSLQSRAGAGLLTATSGTLFFAVYLALFTGVPCLLWHFITKSGSSQSFQNEHKAGGPRSLKLLSLPALLVLGEWARSFFFNGFTSLSLGYSLIDTWMAGYAPVFGLYGLSWIGYSIAVLAVGFVIYRAERAVLIMASALVLMIGLCGFVLGSVKWVEPTGNSLTYRLIQSNVAQRRKFDPLHARRNMEHVASLIESRPADLIITPETAFTAPLANLPADLLPHLQQFSAHTGSHVFLGILTSSSSGNGYNSVVQLRPGLASMAEYDKVRLMPFGEYTPVGFGWFAGGLDIPFKDMRAGSDGQSPFAVREHYLGTLICNEEQLGRGMQHWLPVATIFINPSNLAWFAESRAILQSLQVVRMRALEAGRPVLRVTNTGVTAHIDEVGQVVRLLDGVQEGVLAGTVQPMRGATPYSRWGDWPAVAGCVLVMFFLYRKTKPLLS